MRYTQKIKFISPDGRETLIKNAYIHSDKKLSVAKGVFSSVGETVAIIPSETGIPVSEGDVAEWNNKRFLVISVRDYTQKSRIAPHIKLILE